ncbi:cell division protein FtsW [Bacillus canaveralius]|uniref:Probable peptidoglycan glycosyltransferase FtsW n=1 Tax=Bacillus canaveralius TaxID=1403243 RepID=A0A2N5GNJ5_9BACI|nr:MULTISPECIES: FtsW/RodA/SpoVE family cell cycle protein [Bacillus]PLR84073.1 cell division protein FtsW [Bacillus canaveralius]PLR87305.1 cell division protein FtsW [Bacillus sp. V33-4]PLR96281.1 cell division protein FtsW [Bacillus canaveralius]RSK53533.1 FtsW/RodA/SpoVE family cell cycle protein [Bacillus canaveralius]
MFKKIFKSYDYSLVIAMVLLSLFGLVMIYSASMVTAYDYPSDHFFERQRLHIIGASAVFLFFAMFPYKAMKSNKILGPMVLLSLLCLGALFAFGHIAGNAQSWFKIGPVSLQPSEFVKVSVIIYLAAVYAKKQSYINEFNKGVVPPLFYLFLVSVLIAIQPDYGTAAIIILIASMIIISSGMSLKNLMKLAGIGLMVIAPIFVALQDKILSENRIGRFKAFMDPFAVEQDSGYQITNAFIAIGSGGVNGIGLGKGIQKLGYLPEPHTDFIIAVIAEELGIWGVAFVILLLSYIVLRGIYTGLKCTDPFGSLLAIGISSMIGIQSFINLAGASGIIPLTGVTLPFVSYGGSSLLQLYISMGILVNVSMFVNYEQKYKSNDNEKQVA